MRKLIAGVSQFNRAVQADGDLRRQFERLASGQDPDTLFLTCSDSRIVPHLLTSSEPGRIFVHRNVGNLMPPARPDGTVDGDHSEAAVLEFAVKHLGVRHLVICGHSGCGAMQALMQGLPADRPSPNLEAWLHHGAPGMAADANIPAGVGAGRNPVDRASQRNVLQQLAHIQTHPCVSAALAAGALDVHGWWFDIGAAEVVAFDRKAGRFVELRQAYAEDFAAAARPPPAATTVS